jgi:integrase/recombinase XerD
MNNTKSPSQKASQPAYSLEELLALHLSWLEVRNYSAITIKKRRLDIQGLLKFLAERDITSITQLTTSMLERYQKYLYNYKTPKAQTLTVETQGSKLSSIRMFFKYLARQNYTPYNLASEMDLPKTARRLPKSVLNIEDIELIMNQININTPLGIRDRAMLETFYSTGIRRAELANLCLRDLDKTRGMLMVRQGKGLKDRSIPIGERAMLWIEKYLDEVRATVLDKASEEHLFLTMRGKPISANGLSELVAEYIRKAGYKGVGSCHIFRHTMATLMLEAGADIRFIQKMLGHERLSTTQIYTQVSDKKLKDVHSTTHPGAKLLPSSITKDDSQD